MDLETLVAEFHRDGYLVLDGFFGADLMDRLVHTRDISRDTVGETVVVPGSHRRGLPPA